MYDYFKHKEYFIDHIWFCYEGIHYKGKGVLNWDPNDGFHVSAHIESSDMNLPLKKELKSITFENSVNLYMRLDDRSNAVVPIYFPSKIGLIHGRLSENAKRAIFIQPTSIPSEKSWFGKALFEHRKKIIFPDTVSVKTKIEENQLRHSSSKDGIYFENEIGMKVIGYQKEGKYLEANWNLPIEHWTKTECWEYAQALRYAISILSGQALELKYREVYRPNRIFREVIVNPESTLLGKILRPFDYDILDKEKIIKLANFFARGNRNAGIAKRIFHQMAEASRQNTQQGQELLLSTILEATLRSVYQIPFNPNAPKNSNEFHVDCYIKKFREDYLLTASNKSKSWRNVTNRVLQSYRWLRHRNAHPDWLSTKGGFYSKEELEKASNDMIFLSRFYGYMILGLADIQSEKPLFPLPIAKWKPMMTITISKPDKS